MNRSEAMQRLDDLASGHAQALPRLALLGELRQIHTSLSPNAVYADHGIDLGPRLVSQGKRVFWAIFPNGKAAHRKHPVFPDETACGKLIHDDCEVIELINEAPFKPKCMTCEIAMRGR